MVLAENARLARQLILGFRFINEVLRIKVFEGRFAIFQQCVLADVGKTFV